MGESNLSKFKGLLAELFMFDQADLDFGIYRIMNAKRGEITRFLNSDLLPQVRESLADLASGDRAQIESELAKAIESLRELGSDPESSSKVKELREKLASHADIDAIESAVFSHLYEFFRRYYSEGDFLSLRRYKASVYAIPYEGEEVKLHWANADQYYIKTTENFRDYSFKLPDGRRVHFKVVEADTEENNNKAANGNDRRFIITADDPVSESNGELVIKFEYRTDEEKRKQVQLNEAAIQTVLSNQAIINWISSLASKAPTEKNPDRTLLERHLTEYTARNTFDYFIHKDLGGFLRRELDFYIKNEVMYLDDIESDSAPHVERYLAKVKAMRRIAHKVIDLLTQLENFQKKLWLKKKFVVDTNYCVTLDRVPEELYAEIAANDAQRGEWVRLFAIDEIERDLARKGFSSPLTIEFLKDNPFLMVDTKFFHQEFKDKLLAGFDDLEEIEGLLIHSENFQALQFLGKRYRGKIRYAYIDPPYNTASTPILYKNDYKHSSWASLMQDRLRLSFSLLSNDGVHTIAIDDTELANLTKILEQTAPSYRLTKITVVHNPKGSITKDFNRTHEYALFLTPEELKNCIERTLEPNETPRRMRRWGENSRRIDRRLSFYPIYVVNDKIVRIGSVPDDEFHPAGRNVLTNSGETEIWPIDDEGVERRWNFGLDSINQNLDRIVVQEVNGLLDLFLSHELTVPKTVWTGGEFDAGSYGNSLLINILGQKLFDFPKSIHLVTKCVSLVTKSKPDSIVLDYFPGSGTTGHAVINLNRDDGGKRKYILAEVADYFDTVMKPRIQRIIYSKDWREGKPVSREGVSHAFKYIKLESYEDSLNNIELQRSFAQSDLLERHDAFREDYILRYILDTESQRSSSLLNIQDFDDPFNYKLRVANGSVGESRLLNVDLMETFNYLLGLKVKHIDSISSFRVVEGTNPDGEKVLVIWRNTREKSNADLDKFFQKQAYKTGDNEFDLIYVNGNNNLENLRRADETWKVRLIEQEFHRLMFDVRDV